MGQQFRKAREQQRTGGGISAVSTLAVGRCRTGGIFESTSPWGAGAQAEFGCLGGQREGRNT